VTELAQRIERLVAERTSESVDIHLVEPLIGGACQDNFRVELSIGGARRTLALRSDAASSLPGSLARRAEFPIIEAAVAAGVKTPAVHWLSEGLVTAGKSSYFMDWVDGTTIGRKVLRDEELAGARENLPAELADELAKIHSITPETAPETAPDLTIRMSGAEDVHAVGATQMWLRMHRDALDRMSDARPALELALRWLHDNEPEPMPLRLCHGDFRTGNLAVTPAGLAAVFDWEFAHWGDPMDDLSWLCVRDWRFGRLDRPAGGIATRATMYTEYERATGRAVDPARVHYWEIMNNVRWAIGAVYQGERYLSGAEADIELIAIGRRAVEIEFEALRLIEVGVR
jgi:aminoglycoside phosphotransferase (APT) family kinase protein